MIICSQVTLHSYQTVAFWDFKYSVTLIHFPDRFLLERSRIPPISNCFSLSNANFHWVLQQMNKLGIRSLSDAFKFLKLNIWLCLVLILSVEVFKEVVKNPPFLFFFLFLFATKVAMSKIIPTTAAIISQITAALTTAILILFPIVGETLGPRFNQGAGTRGTTGQLKTSEREGNSVSSKRSSDCLFPQHPLSLPPPPNSRAHSGRWSMIWEKVEGLWTVDYNRVQPRSWGFSSIPRESNEERTWERGGMRLLVWLLFFIFRAGEER